jgi:diguanylate cyclase (GGDEF)-like protein
MFFQNLLKSGWIHALFIGVIAYPLGSLTQKMVASMPDGNILVYTFLFMLSSSCALLFVAGPGELVARTLRRPETWIYSILQIAVLIFGLLIMKYVSATEGVGLYRTAGLFTLLLSALFLQQKMNYIEVLGGGIILLGACLIIKYTNLPIEATFLLIVFVIARSLSQSSQQIITEIHKTNRKAKDFRSQIRVTAFIMAVSSMVFGLLLTTIAFIKQDYNIHLLKSFPIFSDFLNFKVYALAVLVGFFILSVSKYCEFYAGKTIGAKYLTTIISLQIVFVYLAETILGHANIMQEIDLKSINFIALVLILAGNFIISASGFFTNFKFIKKGKIQDTLANMDDHFVDLEEDYEIAKLNLSNLLALYDNNSKNLAEDLGLEKVLLENIINYKFGDFKLDRKIAKHINAFASKNVSLKDKLTKAHNRYSLNHKFNQLLKSGVDFKLYLLDLNKFKPINDTYGHDAGDLVLIETANRLNTIPELEDSVFRIGGDEFVLIQAINLEKDLSDKISKLIEQPINYQEVDLQISTSIGSVLSSQNVELQELLVLADENMYKHKNNK